MFTIEVKDSAVQNGLNELSNRLDHMQPVLQAIGEEIMERAKARFATSTGPDGKRWAPNARSTIESFLAGRSGYYAAFTRLSTKKEGKSRVGDKNGYFLKDGKLGSKGQALMMSKKPLVGESKSLMSQFHFDATDDQVTIGNSMVYAAMQQFGGTKAQFPNLWGDIPARPFMPVRESGFLYDHERDLILEKIDQYMAVK